VRREAAQDARALADSEVARARAQAADELLAVQRESERRLTDLRAQLTGEKAAECVRVREEVSQSLLKQHADTLQQTLHEQRALWEKDMHMAREQWQAQQQRMAADHEGALQALKDEEAARQRQQQQQAERDRLALISAQEAAITTLRAESAAKLSTISRQLTECLEELEHVQSSWQADQQVCTRERAELQQQHEARMQQLRDEMATHVRTERDAAELLRQQITLLNQQLLLANDALHSSQNLQAAAQQQLDDVQREWDSAKLQWLKQREQLEQSVQQTQEAARQAHERAQAELTDMASKHAKEFVARFVCIATHSMHVVALHSCFDLLMCLQCDIE
jgi:hypothetical protein